MSFSKWRKCFLMWYAVSSSITITGNKTWQLLQKRAGDATEAVKRMVRSGSYNYRCMHVQLPTTRTQSAGRTTLHRDAISLQDLRLDILQAQPFGLRDVEDDKHESEHRYGREQKEYVGWSKVPLWTYIKRAVYLVAMSAQSVRVSISFFHIFVCFGRIVLLQGRDESGNTTHAEMVVRQLMKNNKGENGLCRLTCKGEKANVTNAFEPKFVSTARLIPRPLVRSGKISETISQLIGPNDTWNATETLCRVLPVSTHRTPT